MHTFYMKEAIKEALLAYKKDEVPIGCIIVHNENIIARAHNLREKTQYSTAHAEILAIEQACEYLHSWRLENCILYVTLEPCAMCSGAILQSRIKKVIYGSKDPKGGCIDSCVKLFEHKGFNHYPEFVSGILEKECGDLLKRFFKEKRLKKKSRYNNI